MPVPESAKAFHARIQAAADASRRLPVAVDAMPGWDIFPYETEGLRIKPLRPMLAAEHPRHGDDPSQCGCGSPGTDERLVWRNERWRLTHVSESGLPLQATLDPVEHHDLEDLPDELAAELGVLMVAVSAAIESLPSVGRTHVMKIGDGAAHLHLWFLGRPALTDQFLGSPLLDWEENFPRVPVEVLRANAASAAAQLVARVGGEVGPFGR